MNAPSPNEKRMWREALHTQMRMLLRCLENNEPVPRGLRKRTYNQEYLKFFQDERAEYIELLESLPSPAKAAPVVIHDYLDRVRKHAKALDVLRTELKHLNRRVDLDDSQKRQKRPGIIRRYAKLREEFRLWLEPLEAAPGFPGAVKAYLCKPRSGEKEYHWGRQYPWFYRFISVTEFHQKPSVDEYMVLAEIHILRAYLERDADTE